MALTRLQRDVCRVLAERRAREIVDGLPPDHAGSCVLDDRAGLLRAPPPELARALAGGQVRFHRGRLRGAFPELRPDPAG